MGKLKNMQKNNLSLVGFLQAIGVAVYCALISGILYFGDNFVVIDIPIYFRMVLVLMLLVFSAAVTGSLVFGYPIYLALQKETRKALKVLSYTFLYCLGIIAALMVVMFLL